MRLHRNDPLLRALVTYTALYHKPFSAEALSDGLPLDPQEEEMLFSHRSSKALFSRAAARAGLKAALIERPIHDILSLQLPVILVMSRENALILEAFNEDRTQVKVIYPDDEATQAWVTLEVLEEEYLGFAYMLKKAYVYSEENKRTLHIEHKHWFWGTLNLSRKIYGDVLWATLLVNLLVLATPLFTMNIYDRVIPNNAIETLWVFTIGVIIVYALDTFLKFTRTYMIEQAAKKSDIIMSSIIFEKVINMKMEAHSKSVGSFANNIRDFESIRGFMTNATITALVDIPFAVIFLIVIGYLGGMLVFIPLVTIFIILGYALSIRKPLQASIERSHEASAKKSAILIESLQNIETVKSMSMSSKVQFDWEESNGEIAEKSFKTKLLSTSIPTITGLMIQLSSVAVVVYGVYLIQEFELTMGGLIAVVILTSRVLAPMGQAAALVAQYEDAKTSYDMLNEIMSRPEERPHGKQFVQKPQFTGLIEFKEVMFTYPGEEVYALNNVSFCIQPGEHVGIVGRMGSGKSTIEKLLLRLYEPQSGSILIDGLDISQIDPADLRRAFGYVPQDVHLFRGTIKDNILNGARFHNDEAMIRASRLSGTDEFIRKHPRGYEMEVYERGLGLSGGQRQSVGIARALVDDPEMLLFDEPSNAMDQTSEQYLIDQLKSYIEGKTMLMVTQKLSTLVLTKRLIVMHNGAVVQDGMRDEVLKALSGAQNGQ
ncbi:MAG: type I secretion system permease/ATPase [Sulfuricurvum sp.]|nr:type I secretion system permease/ATPase [Sulfuricurvum sp.]